MIVHEDIRAVILSRANLEALLAMLNGYGDEDGCVIRRRGWMVVAEEDERHYADRNGCRGVHQPEVEREMERIRHPLVAVSAQDRADAEHDRAESQARTLDERPCAGTGHCEHPDCGCFDSVR